MSLKINASKATINGDNLAGPIEQRQLTINNKQFTFEDINLYVEQLNAFVYSIINKTQPEVTLEEGLKNVAQLVSIKNNLGCNNNKKDVETNVS